MSHLLAYCRAGFEADLAVELTAHATEFQLFGFARFDANSGFIQFEFYQPDHALKFVTKVDFKQLIFARQLLLVIGSVADLPREDRVSRLLQCCPQDSKFGQLWVEYPDTTEGRELSKFCRKFAVPLRQALRKHGVLSAKENPQLKRLHVFFPSGKQAVLACSLVGNSAEQPLGILRLKFPRQAPSRSTLKLDEAIQLFIGKKQQQLFKSGMRGVDLGACPGGWTYQLVQRGLKVDAIDNGKMDDDLMASGMVNYVAADGFKYRPNQPVDWLVCDMIEQPQRVAALMAKWLVNGDCKAAIFNLKLPMKKRYQAVQEALMIIQQHCKQAGREFRIQAKHLYHDREEITLYLF